MAIKKPGSVEEIDLEEAIRKHNASLAASNPFVDSIEGTFIGCLDIVKRKSADYASLADPFKNFRACENLGVSVEKGILVRMSDKLNRIANLCEREAQVADESIYDTIHDIINYAAILKAYRISKETF